jgi:hypothetical protein
MTDDSRRLTTSDIAATEAKAAMASVDHNREDRSRHDRPVDVQDEPNAALFVNEDADAYRTRWSGIQAGFVDEPRLAVEEADALVAEVIRRLAEGFADERRTLEAQWEHTDRVSTEDLRQAMRRYRSFFERLLAV